MVTVSSAFISSRRERIIFRVLSASGCAFKAAAWVDVLRAVFEPVVLEPLGKTDLDNTDVARDHSFHCIASGRILGAAHGPYYACGVNGFNIPVAPQRHSRVLLICPPATVGVPKSSRGQGELHAGEEHPGRRALIRQARSL